jgi:hypothetical protein
MKGESELLGGKQEARRRIREAKMSSEFFRLYT